MSSHRKLLPQIITGLHRGMQRLANEAIGAIERDLMPQFMLETTRSSYMLNMSSLPSWYVFYRFPIISL